MEPSSPESIDAGKETFLTHVSVPHETTLKLERYVELLKEWNEKFNLVAKSTLPEIWTRHILDSAQLKNHIPESSETLADIGSGAGFPGIVLSILGVPQVHLIESTGKKANFLKTVVEELKLNAVVHHGRAEGIKNLKVDVVTARAVGSLSELLKLAKPLLKKDSLCLFLKGKSVDGELAESRRYLRYKLERHTSVSDPSGSILLIRGLAPATHFYKTSKRNKT
ncbi:MAG: 16S rRNA (guanine(527)-N(7))-methyltransferase RsmG [Bdellovibrionales bacterium]